MRGGGGGGPGGSWQRGVGCFGQSGVVSGEGGGRAVG